jgi:hypothetical protein
MIGKINCGVSTRLHIRRTSAKEEVSNRRISEKEKAL